MAGSTLRRGAGIAVGMAFRAGSIQVRSGQRKCRSIVIKGIIGISRRVTGEAGRIFINIAIYTVVPVVCFRIGMTNGTGKFRVIGRIGMAIGAGRPLSLVFTAVYREILRIVQRKLCRHPVRIGGVALRTIVCEIPLYVVWIGGRFKIRLVTGKAVIGRIVKRTSRVAALAITDFMAFLKREKAVIYFIGLPLRRKQIMAFEAIFRKSRLGMIRIGSLLEISPVATDAVITNPLKLQG